MSLLLGWPIGLRLLLLTPTGFTDPVPGLCKRCGRFAPPCDKHDNQGSNIHRGVFDHSFRTE
jgi:hypothetical protein